ncbi:MAG: S24 family peptidase [Clostridiales bacterium]
MDLEDFSKRLKKFANSSYGGVGKLAERLGITQPQLSNYTSGNREPKASFLNSLAQIGCDVNWLLTGQVSGHKYIPLDEAEGNPVKEQIEYKIVASVPAGIAEVQDYDWYETAPLDYHPENHAFIKVDQEFGYSMMPTIAPGDLVLINFNVKPKNGDLVAARWDETKGALKIYSENPDIPNMAVLTSYNQAIAPIFVSKKKVKIYKVVLIKKNN